MLFDRVAGDWKPTPTCAGCSAGPRACTNRPRHRAQPVPAARCLRAAELRYRRLFSQQNSRCWPRWCAAIGAGAEPKAFDVPTACSRTRTHRRAAAPRCCCINSPEAAQLPELRAGAKRREPRSPARWLDQRPLLRADLDGEPADVAGSASTGDPGGLILPFLLPSTGEGGDRRMRSSTRQVR